MVWELDREEQKRELIVWQGAKVNFRQPEGVGQANQDLFLRGNQRQGAKNRIAQTCWARLYDVANVRRGGACAKAILRSAAAIAPIRSSVGTATSTVEVTRVTSAAFAGTPDKDFNSGDVNSMLSDMRSKDLRDGGDGRAHYFGLVFDGGGFMRGSAGVPGSTGSGPAGGSTYGGGLKAQYKFSKAFRLWVNLSARHSVDDVLNDSVSRSVSLGAALRF